MTETPDKLLEELDALHKKATPGEWQRSRFVDSPKYRNRSDQWKKEMRAHERLTIRGPGLVGTPSCNPVLTFRSAMDSDIDAIIALRNAYPTLRQHIAAAERKALEKACRAVCIWCDKGHPVEQSTEALIRWMHGGKLCAASPIRTLMEADSQ